MRVFGVEVSVSCLKHHAHMLDAPELVHVQALVAHAAVERLGEALLPRLSRLDVMRGRTLGFEAVIDLAGRTASASRVNPSTALSALSP